MNFLNRVRVTAWGVETVLFELLLMCSANDIPCKRRKEIKNNLVRKPFIMGKRNKKGSVT